MELNSPQEILINLVGFGIIGGVVIYALPLTVQQVLDRALQNWLLAVPIGLSLVFLFLFGGRGSGAGGE